MDAPVGTPADSPAEGLTALMAALKIPFDEPGNDYITDIEARRDIFLQFKKFQDDHNILLGLNAVAFAIILVAPLDRLQHYASMLHTEQFNVCAIKAAGIFGRLHIDAVLGIKAFIRGGRWCHSEKNQIHCRENVRFACTLCGTTYPERCPIRGTTDTTTTRIIPPMDKRNASRFGGLVQAFWGQDMANLWTKLSKNREFRRSAQNRVHVSHQLHMVFAEAKMALKPLCKTDDGSIIVQFYWLKETLLKPQDFVTKPHDSVSFDELLNRAGLADNQAWGTPLARRKGGRRLKSGQIFVLKENQAKDIPSFDLLRLSWDLTRVAAICGAANSTDDLLRETDVLDFLISCEGEDCEEQ